MAVIVDYYKNDVIYNNDLIDLIPTDLGFYFVDNRLKKSVQKYDELTFNKRKELSDIATQIRCDEKTLIYSMDNGVNVGYYYDNNDFVIKTFVSSEYIIGDVPYIVSHIFSEYTHIIKIERDIRYGNIPPMDLISMKEAFTDRYVSKESINVIAEELDIVNRSLENFYCRKLTKRK